MLLRILVLAATILVVAHGANNHVPACSVNEIYQKCDEHKEVKCEFTCDNFRLPNKPLCECVPKCKCLSQYVRNMETEECVYRFQCPNTWWPWTGFKPSKDQDDVENGR